LTPCKVAVALFFAPLALGVLVGVMVSDHVLAAVERGRRERRREAERRVTRDMTPGYWKRIWTEPPSDTPTVTTVASSDGDMEMRNFRWDAEARWFIRDTTVQGPVIDWLYEGGAMVNVRN